MPVPDQRPDCQSRDILAFMGAEHREIHGYLSGLGYRVFPEAALASAARPHQ
jgi:hypothetical protein